MASKMDIDRSLDEIIATKPNSRRPKQNGARRAGGASTGASGARARYASNVPKASPAAATHAPLAAETFKIIISNLPHDVTEAAIRDLMQSTVGPVKFVQMSYTANGRSTGVATVIFRNRGDAKKAHSSYHNRIIDNQRPLKVELAVDPNRSLAGRVAPAPAQQLQRRRAPAPSKPREPRAPRQVKKTAEQLDAEMAEYKQTTTE